MHQGYIEPHACLISVAADNKTTIWSSSQGQFMVRAMTAYLTGIPQSDIRAIPAEIGGGFGGKTIVYLEPLATLLAKKSGRPVKMVMTREEVMRATGPTSGSKSTVKIGAKKDGTIVAAQGTFYLQAGAFPGSPIRGAVGCSFAPYDIPNVLSVGFDVSPTAPKSRPIARRARRSAPMRSNACSMKLAEALKMDPLELAAEKRRQGRHQGRARPGLPAHRLYRDGGGRQELGALPAPLGKTQGPGRRVRLLVQRRRRIPRRSTSPRTATSSSRQAILISAARAPASPTSAPSCSASTTAASRSSSATPQTIGFSNLTGGSRVLFASAIVVTQSAEKVIQTLRERAAKIWKIDPEAVKWEQGAAHPVSPNAGQFEPLTLKELAEKAPAMGGPIGAGVQLNTAGADGGFGTHICDVEVDVELGIVRVIRYTAIQDVGRAIHPAMSRASCRAASARASAGR